MEDQQINRSIVSYMEKHLVVQSPLWWRWGSNWAPFSL
jgi:hypothetical protein